MQLRVSLRPSSIKHGGCSGETVSVGSRTNSQGRAASGLNARNNCNLYVGDSTEFFFYIKNIILGRVMAGKKSVPEEDSNRLRSRLVLLFSPPEHQFHERIDSHKELILWSLKVLSSEMDPAEIRLIR
jgi:hypothetical protein